MLFCPTIPVCYRGPNHFHHAAKLLGPARVLLVYLLRGHSDNSFPVPYQGPKYRTSSYEMTSYGTSSDWIASYRMAYWWHPPVGSPPSARPPTPNGLFPYGSPSCEMLSSLRAAYRIG